MMQSENGPHGRRSVRYARRSGITVPSGAVTPRAEKRLAWDVTDATPTGDEIACISCGGPLLRRENRFFLKYFLFGHPIAASMLSDNGDW
jgi:hypothetical protein